MKHRYILVFVGFSFIFYGCYTFKNASIPSDVKTFYVETFQTTDPTAPGDLNQRFSDALRNKIRNESRLIYAENAPDVEFTGTIKGFRLTDQAIIEGNTVAFVKLEIIVAVVYTNNKAEDKSWKSDFSFFRTFPSDRDFVSIQDRLINEIFNQLLEDIFNKAFATW